MARTNQGGSIVGFVIIGAVLVLGSAGLLYWVSHRDETPIKTPEVSVPAATEKPSNESSSKEKTETPTNSDPDTNKEKTDNTQGNESQPTPNSNDVAVDQIPQTGPADTLVQLLAIGLLAGVGVAFVRSHKHRSTL